MAELPERGPRVEHHQSWADQPFSEAAFDPLDRDMLHRASTPPRQPAVSNPITYYPADADNDINDLTLYDGSDSDEVYGTSSAPVLPDARPRQHTRRAA